MAEGEASNLTPLECNKTGHIWKGLKIISFRTISNTVSHFELKIMEWEMEYLLKEIPNSSVRLATFSFAK